MLCVRVRVCAYACMYVCMVCVCVHVCAINIYLGSVEDSLLKVAPIRHFAHLPS